MGLLDIFNYGTGGSYYDEQKKKLQDSSYASYMGRTNQVLDPYAKYKKDTGPKKSLEDIARGSQYGIGRHIPQPKQQIDTSSAMPGNLGDRGGSLGQRGEDLNWWKMLAKKTGVDFDKAAAHWKDKGGFEGLMANPAFTLGLAIMQSSAQGKRIDSELMDNFVKSAGLSAAFKDRMKAKAGGVIEATTAQMNQIKSVLGTMGISGPGWRKMLPGNQSESYEQAVEDITIKVQQKVNKMKKDAEASGKNIVVGSRLYKKIIQDMINSGELKTKRVFFDKTLEAKPMAKGGPIKAGKPYIVGEQGPEVIIPNASGNVLSNDNSQIFAMLLAANPQLQNVSRTRSEKILRNRFPEYFE